MTATKEAEEKKADTSSSTSSTGMTSGPSLPSPRPIGGLHHEQSRTYISQSVLPRLPIPTLEETMKRFGRAVWAVQTATERAETERVVEEFLSTEGPKLQSLLEEYDEEGERNGTLGSYVEEFWSDAYLAPDTSVVMNLNPFFLLEDGPDAKLAKSQVGRAASLVFASAKMASVLRREDLCPDVFKGRPLCMDQFKALFGSCRIPRASKDCVEVVPNSQHIVVLAKNQFYYFTALWPDGTVAVNESDIKEILQAILKDASRMDPEVAIKQALGVLTTQQRKHWAVIRDNLVASSAHNATAMEIVDSALFVLALDDCSPNDVHEGVANMLHGTYKLESKTKLDHTEYVQAGTCCNRWYDKLQIIVCADGSAGVNFEHSAIDGHTALRFASDVFAETIVSFAQSITKTIYGKASPDSIADVIKADVRRASAVINGVDTSPKKLEFSIPGSVADEISYAEAALGDEIFASDTYALEFKKYGKNFITGNKMSPDSFVQMSMLVAYHSLYGKACTQYEPVLTKQFYHGRIEAMRTTTPQAAALCEVFSSRFTSKEEKLKALQDAAKEHSLKVKEAAAGKGVDRHLFALKCIAEKNGMGPPKFFESGAWKALNHTVLSTSNCGNPALRHFGFGPVVPDGFGIGYVIKDDGLQYSISSKHRQTQRYAQTLLNVLLEFEKIMEPLTSVRVARGCEIQRNVSLQKKDSAVEYAEGVDYFGESASLPPSTHGPSMPRNDSTGYFARVIRRNSSMTAEQLQQAGKLVESLTLGEAIEEVEHEK
mmetsp:Transcript_9653/g.21608  ORF Transcript_9653/g.21608 Transcript_9653/m.21608 type:complete len:772 (+) Transcript_9653:254-2569(+)